MRPRAVALGALAALLAVAGCGSRGPTAEGRTVNAALALFPEEAARYQAFAAQFERLGGVRLRLVPQTYGDIRRALQAQAGARRGSLDLVELDLAMLGQARAWVQPLDSVVPASARALFPPAAWEAGSAGGHLYFIPHRLMWQAMIYNRAEVPRPPASWEELRRFARAHPGKLGLKGALYEGAICDVAPFVWEAGGDLLAPDSPAAMAALDFLQELAPDLNSYSPVFREMSILEAQARGSVWIHFNWPFAMSYLSGKGLAPSPNLSAPIPAGPGGRATVLGGGYLAIARAAPHRAAALAFLRYLLTARAQTRLSRTLGWYGSVPPPPGSRDALLYAGFAAMRLQVRARPVIDCYSSLSNRWQRAIRAALFDHAPANQALKPVTLFAGQSGARARDCP